MPKFTEMTIRSSFVHIRPLVKCLLRDIMFTLELKQETIGFLSIELEENILQFLLLLLGVDI